MLKTALIAAAVLCALASSAEACIPTSDIMRPCAYQADFLAGVRSIRVKMRRIGHHQKANKTGHKLRVSILFDITHQVTSGIIGPLAAKVSEIRDECGSSVVSGLRHTFIAGTRRMSLHASGKAVDMSGNPSCIYAHLADWQGGVSIDYRRVRHVHLSYDPEGHREWGVRFVHGRNRYAHRRHARYRVAG